MRLIGYTLLVIGFLWLAVWCAGSTEPLLRAIGIEHFKNYPGTQTYSGDQVCDAIRSAFSDYSENQHGVILPAVLMLAGGVVLDVSTRRKGKQIQSR